jgi:hypothetical protein
VISWILFTATMALGIWAAPKMDDKALGPWDAVGSAPYVSLINLTPDTMMFFAQAPEIDDATRFLGLVPPQDSAIARVPYADAKVFIRAAPLMPGHATIDITSPGLYRVQVNP